MIETSLAAVQIQKGGHAELLASLSPSWAAGVQFELLQKFTT